MWANIQKKTTAVNIRKNQALSHFTGQEITQAKIDLWKTAGENTLGKIKHRKENAKHKGELDVISTQLAKLAEIDTLPIFLGTSDMVSKTHVFNVETESCDNTVVLNQLKVLEKSLKQSLAQPTSQTDNSQFNVNNSDRGRYYTGG